MRQVLAPLLVGRGVQLAEVDDLLDAAAAGRGRAVALVGEAGVGKTRLSRAAAERVRARGGTVLSGRASPAAEPYRALVAALLPHARTGPPPREDVRHALGPLVAEWDTGTARARSAEATAPVLAEALVRLLSAAPAPALLLLEDLHWAEPETLDVLDCLVDLLPEARAGCLVTLRPDPSRASAWLDSAAARRAVRAVPVERLDDAETVALARSCLTGSRAAPLPAALEHWLTARSEGLPLLVEDLLAGLVSAGVLVETGGGDGAASWSVARPLAADVPSSYAATVRHRLAALDPGARQVLAAAAVLGRDIEWSLLGPLTHLDDAEVLAALRAAVQAQVVVADGDRFSFRHAATRDVVLADLLPPERAATARAAAAEVVRRHPGLPGHWCRLVAALHQQSGDLAGAAVLLTESGRRAAQRGALRSAEADLRQACDGSSAEDAPAAELALVEVLVLAGKQDEAQQRGEALLARPGAVTGEERTALRLLLARAATTAGDRERARAQLDRLQDDGPPTGAPREQARALRAVLAADDGAWDEAEPLARAALAAAEEAGLWDVACEVLEVLGRCARSRGDAPGAEAAFVRAHDTAAAHALDLARLRALSELGTLDLFSSGRSDRLEAARELAEGSGALVTAAHADLHLGILLAHRDDPGDAERADAALRRCAERARLLRLAPLLPVALAQRAYARVLVGDADGAQALAAQALAVAPASPDARVLADGLVRPLVLLLDEDLPAALAATEAVVPLLSHGVWPTWGLRALLRAVLDDRPEQARDEALDASAGAPVGIGAAFLDLATAVLHGRTGRARAAEEACARGQAALSWQRAPRRYALRLVAGAAVQDGWGEPVPWLRGLLPELVERDMRPMAAACRELLRRAGAPAPRGAPPLPPANLQAGVTAREAEVLELVASGLGNPAIAARLHLSRRTVESHVASLLLKTGAGDRRGLAEVARAGP